MAPVAKTKEIAQALHPKKITVKEAVASAMYHFHELFPMVGANVMLEEIEMSDDDKFWLVTLGYNSESVRRGPLDFSTPRAYKTFSIDSTSAKLKSVKIRSIA